MNWQILKLSHPFCGCHDQGKYRWSLARKRKVANDADLSSLVQGHMDCVMCIYIQVPCLQQLEDAELSSKRLAQDMPFY